MADATPLYALIAHETPEWRAIERYIRGQIDRRQNALEADLDPTATANLRGRIAELRLLLKEATVPENLDNTDFEDASPLY